MSLSMDIVIAIGVCWFLPVLLWSMGESTKNWIVSSNPILMKFRKPIVTATGWIVLALLYPASFGLFMIELNPVDWKIALCIFCPLSLILCAVTVNAAAPKTVVLNLAAQTCSETKGWFSQTTLRKQELTDETRLLFCWTSNYYLLYLQTCSDNCKPKFLLGQTNSKKNLDFVANELSQKLAVPIIEGSLRQVAKL